jgi:Tol biopolymer transport system component
MPQHFLEFAQVPAVIGWAPDDSWVLFWYRDEQEDIFTRFYVSDGIVERLSVSNGPPLWGHFACLSPDGTQMAMMSGPPGDEKELVVITLSEGRRHPLGVKGGRLMCAWSPDGTELVVTRNRRVPRSNDVLIVPASGGSVRLLAEWARWERDLGNAGPPGWSPDGKHVIFVVHSIGRGSHNCLMSLPASGGEEPRLFYRPKSAHPIPWKPYWSSDGSTIFFTGFMREYQVWMMNGFQESF